MDRYHKRKNEIGHTKREMERRRKKEGREREKEKE